MKQQKREINEFNNVVSGTMKIGASFTIGEYYLPKVLAEFAAQYPMVDIQIIISNSNDVIQGIRSNKLDIGLIEGETDYKDIDVRPFMNDEMIVVVPRIIHFHRWISSRAICSKTKHGYLGSKDRGPVHIPINF